MSSKTTNYNLNKPDQSEYYDIQVQNDNMDLIDAALKDLNDTKATKVVVNSIKESVTALESNKSNTNHTHDDRYYTETEVNDKLAAKAEKVHGHTKSDISDFPASLPANGGNADTVGGFTVKTNVPADAKFTDTVYSHPSTHPASMITGLPTSLPANGGNADTVDGKHASDFVLNSAYNGATIASGDLNNYYTNGTYHFAGATNSPETYGVLVVYTKPADSATNRWVNQLAFCTTGNMYWRQNINNGGWGSWKKINDGGNADAVDGWHVDLTLTNYAIKPIAMNTVDITAGVSTMPSGYVYIVYE